MLCREKRTVSAKSSALLPSSEWLCKLYCGSAGTVVAHRGDWILIGGRAGWNEAGAQRPFGLRGSGWGKRARPTGAGTSAFITVSSHITTRRKVKDRERRVGSHYQASCALTEPSIFIQCGLLSILSPNNPQWHSDVISFFRMQLFLFRCL